MGERVVSDPSAEVPTAECVNDLLALPKAVRQGLADLLLDSVREDFASLEEVERRDREEIRRRTERALSGEEPTHDGFEVIEELRRRLAGRYKG